MSFEPRLRIGLLRLIVSSCVLAYWVGKLGYHLVIRRLGGFVRGIYQKINVEEMNLMLSLIRLMRATLRTIE